ncbi:protein KASH5-like isoform X2 [Polyodon spathula]|uniref:protein KASH5-like isoform X2 n=1 Tax=Polyodon spathula TaxID=7913 RepID=UPI001B7E8515|nr:protein KASH5-like isoform X2 [Polyodon spathula]
MKAWVAEVREDGSEMREIDEVEFVKTVSLLHPGKKTGGSTAQLEGYGGETSRVTVEPADLLSSIEGLEFTNRRLVERNEKLQRAVEGSEETSSHLNEEISLLQQQLRSSQYALQQARSVSEELEELKGAAKALEETNSHLRRHTKQLEREQQARSAETRTRQEESGRLAAERDRLRWRVEELTEDKAELKALLSEMENVLASKDAVITERGRETERLQESVKENSTLIQELKAEISRLQDQLTLSYRALTAAPQESPLVCSSLQCRDRTESSLQCRDRTESSLQCRDRTESSLQCRDRTESSLQCRDRTESSLQCRDWTERSLQLEIQQVDKDTDTAGLSLPSPLCGMLVSNVFDPKEPSLPRNPGLGNDFLQQSSGEQTPDLAESVSADLERCVNADWSGMQLVPVVQSLVPVSRQLVQFRRTSQGNRLSRLGCFHPLTARSCLSCIGLACAVLLVSLCSLLYQSTVHSFKPASSSTLASLWHLIIQTLRSHVTLRHLSPPPV